MIIALAGTNDFMLSNELHALVDNYVKEYGDLGLERYDAEELDPNQLPSVLQAMPFLSTRRLVVLRQPSAQKALQEKLEQLLDTVPETTELVIVESRPDKRTTYYKSLQKQTDFRSYEPLNEQQLADWLVRRAEELGGKLASSEARYLVQRLGTNQLMLSNELEKLINYNSNVTQQAINDLTEPAPQSSVFDLLEAAFRGQRQTVNRLYLEQRQQKVEPLAILAMIAWQLHIFALIKTAGDRSPQALASEAKVSPYVVSKSASAARNFDLTELKDWIHLAAQLDIELKSQPIEADDALLNFLLSLSTS